MILIDNLVYRLLVLFIINVISTSSLLANSDHSSSFGNGAYTDTFAWSTADNSRQLIVIDEGVADYQVLLKNLPANTSYLLLNSQRSGLSQIADALANDRLYSAVHLVSHGESGALLLGNSRIDNSNLDSYQQALARIKSRLAPGADLLLYGCDVAANPLGEFFLRRLENLTGADIAASTNLTGNLALGGDWQLEYQSGNIETPIPFSAKVIAQFSQVLTHFYGGAMSWRSVELDNDSLKNDVEVSLVTAWRVDAGGLNPAANEISLSSSPALTFTETSFQELDIDGAYKLITVRFTASNISPSTQYLVEWGDGNRVSTLVNNADENWSILSTIYVKDGNLAPQVELPLFFEVPQKNSDNSILTNWTFDISSLDPNADKLRYRLAKLSDLSNVAAFVNPDGFSIDGNTGTITWMGSGNLSPGLYSAGIIAEDLDDSGVVKSKSHIDFILDVQNKATTAFNLPTSFPSSRNIIVESGSNYSFTIAGASIASTSLGNIRNALTELTDSTFSFDPLNLDPGVYPITFEVKDTTNTTVKNYLTLNFIVPDPDAPTISNIADDKTVYANIVEQIVDESLDVLVMDANNTDLNGGKLKFNVSFSDGQYEILNIKSVGDAAGEIRVNNQDVFYEGALIGTIDNGDNGVGRALQIDFSSAAATPAAIQQLVRSLSYQDNFVLRSPGERDLSIFIQDQTGLSNFYNLFVDVQDHPEKPSNGGPLLANNSVNLVNGEVVTISNTDLRYVDPDTAASDVILTLSNIANGQFELTSAPGVPVSSLTQQDVDLGVVKFVHANNNLAPSYDVVASDGAVSTISSTAAVTFSSATGETVSINENKFGVTTVTAVNVVGTPTFAIASGADQALFSIDVSSGALRFNSSPDFETPIDSDTNNSYTVAVSVTGATSGVDIQTIIVIIHDIDESAPATPTVTNPVFTNDVTPEITGTAEASSILTILMSGATYNISAAADGSWSLNTGTAPVASGSFNPDINGSNEVVVTSIDAAGNYSPQDISNNEINIDVTSPIVVIAAITTATKANETNYIVTGTCVSGDNDVAISIAGASPVTSNVVCSASNVWRAEFDVSGLADGSNAITLNASQSDAAGNATIATPLSADKDTVTPLVSITAIPVSATNSIPEFSGTTDGIAGSTVTVKNELGTPVCNATVVAVSPDNRWACLSNIAISEGVYPYTAAIDDGFGNIQEIGFMLTIDMDADNDGIPDILEGTGDTDNDGVADYLDSDSDNDNIADAVEENGLPLLSGDDSDGDGIDDVIDVSNTAGLDANNDGIDDAFFPADLDADGISDYLDNDTDNDNIPDLLEGSADQDADGIPNYRDTDSDQDGIPDRLENLSRPVLQGSDSDSDGIDDGLDVDTSGGIDLNFDGVDDAFEPINSDNDGLPDYLDVDSDNDGLPDAIEAQIIPLLSGNDTDSDGIDDAFDVDAGNGVDTNADGVDDAMAPNDSDQDGLADYVDLDSDNDGIPDAFEGGAIGLDTDLDGLDDAFDVNQTGGLDSNNDGIDDISARLDSDQDGIPNVQDLDSDNDGVPDVVEAGLIDDDFDGFVDDGVMASVLTNSDGTDEPDYIDLDRDNDGIFDIINSGASQFDLNADGQIDAEFNADSDGDGALDVIDGEPSIAGFGADSDFDGIPNKRDLDDDNDGILDSIEAADEVDFDSDSDGIIDRLDLDSDNDGIPDSVEGADSFVGDTDLDGVLNDFIDSDANGLADYIDTNRAIVDTDADGIADYLDLDSDNDGITDISESVTDVITLDADNDGRLDSSTDLDRDGLIDVVDTQVNDVLDNSELSLQDMDNDGLANYRDLDSDGDGLTDTQEQGDFNGDGIDDRLQNEGKLETAVSGYGSLDFFTLPVFSLLLLIRAWVTGAIKTLSFSVIAIIALLSSQAQASGICHRNTTINDNGHRVASQSDISDSGIKKYNACWFASIGLGLSRINPQGESNGWHTVDEYSGGYKLALGYQFKPHWFAELAYTDAGSAKLGNYNPAVTDTPGMTYRIPSLFTGYWLRAPEKDFNVYGKLGIGIISNKVTDNRVPFERNSSAQIALGLGLQWRFDKSWFIRIEFDSYDRDARYLGASIGRYFGGYKNQVLEKPIQVIEPEVFANTIGENIPVETHPMESIEEENEVLETAPALLINVTIEPTEEWVAKAVIVCEQLVERAESVQFKVNSAQLTESAMLVLTEVSLFLLQTPEIEFEIQGHTDNLGSSFLNQRLSQQRAEAVKDFFLETGVSPERLTAVGYGEINPVASNDTIEGRQTNRRVVFNVVNAPVCH